MFGFAALIACTNGVKLTPALEAGMLASWYTTFAPSSLMSWLMVSLPACPVSLSCACSANLDCAGVCPVASIGPRARLAWYTVCFFPG